MHMCTYNLQNTQFRPDFNPFSPPLSALAFNFSKSSSPRPHTHI